MIYSGEKKFLFIHIPKTAGTSIRSVLEPYGGKPGIFNFVARRLERFPVLPDVLGLNKLRTYDAHITYQKVSSILSPEKLDPLFVFAFVRNPFDRLYSFYLHILAHPQHTWFPKIKAYGSFQTMLKHLDEVNEPTQKSYLVDKNNVIRTNFIGHFEQIDQDFKFVCDKLDIPFDLPKKNVRNHKSWKDAYTESDRKFATDFYKEDFEAFGYNPQEQ